MRHEHVGSVEVRSARAWETSHHLLITRNLRDEVRDQFSDRSAGESRAEVCSNAGDEDLLVRRTIIDICIRKASNCSAHNEIEATRSWTERPRLSWTCSASLLQTTTALTGIVDHNVPLDESGEAQLEWDQVLAEWIATDFPGCEPALQVAKEQASRWMRGS